MFIRIIGLGLMLIDAVAVLSMIYNMFKLTNGAKPERRDLVRIIFPVAMFLPSLWTREGNRRRIRFFVSAGVSGLCLSCLLLLKQFLPPQ
jgi:hypothetical protein